MPLRRPLVYGQRMQLPLRRLPHVQPRVSDAALAVVLFALGQAETWTPFKTSLGHGSSIVVAALGAAMTLPLAFRRFAPLAVALLVAVPTPLIAAFTPVRLLFFGGFLPLLVVTYTLASRARTARSLAAVALPFAALLVVELEVADFRKSGEVVFDWLWFSVAAVVGLVVRGRSLRAERSESRVATLETERETVLREERGRIARELHDVIAHSVSVIVIQAGAAEPLVDDDPDQAREALRSIRSTASDALGEMRRLLGILRTADDESCSTRSQALPNSSPCSSRRAWRGWRSSCTSKASLVPSRPGSTSPPTGSCRKR
jgi:signal transduction histidine kinase